MPARAPRPCSKAGCGKLTRDKSGRCELHPKPATNWQEHQDRHGNRHERGYGTAWERLRRVILHRDQHLCQVCKAQGIYTPAHAVDHIIPKAHEGTDDPRNLQSICPKCHAAKSSRESSLIVKGYRGG